ncbi:MAG TPA: DUF5666 domain-containing protein [Chloroflexota bacterium]|nr:DUF5666 domain-containing protein [Chloroflexota bacterium]
MRGFARGSAAVFSAAVIGIATQLSVLAQPPGAQILGTVERIDDNTVHLADSSTFALTEATRFTRITAGEIADLVPGVHVSISASRDASGTLTASLIDVNPASAPSPESQREMTETRFCEPGCNPSDLMTNAVIDDAILDAVSGGMMSISFAGESGLVAVSPLTRIEIQTIGTIDDLAPGARIIGFVDDQGAARSVWIYGDER